ncbi:phage head spike fiber domain-containing protein [Ancylobacter polymorphus]|uniref:Uncharacterized protein n=1 Tax=Ancylobacter polymorphus TaxID=223390 RepID=A0A9E7A8L2_9HYPH|nr:hypothetical protein [Ancylobacter polymorphus]UOK71718.1 hypothetical protein K9D25_03045 [Ancylobacter polymorphus]
MPTLTYANIGKVAINPTLQDLFRYGETGAAYDAFDLSSLFQDAAGTSPATIVGQQIALVSDRIHATHARQSSVSLRPLIGRAPKDRRNIYLGSDLLEGSSPNTVNGATLVRDGVGFGTTLTGTSGASILQMSAPIASGRTVSFFAAAGTSGSIGVGSTGGAITASFNLVTGVASSGNNTTDAAMEHVSGGYRCSFKALTSANLRLLPGTGSINLGKLQIEDGPLTPYQSFSLNGLIMTEEGVPSYYFARLDMSDDRLDTVLPQAVTGDVVIAGRNGTLIAPASYAAGSTFQLGPTSYTGGVSNILRAVGDVVGWTVIGRTLTAAERKWLLDYYKERGAKGLLVPGPELVVNGTFDVDASGWTPSSANVTAARNASGQLEVTNNGAGWVSQTINTVAGKTYRVEVNWSQKQGAGRFNIGTVVGGASLLTVTTYGNYTGTAATTFVASGSTAVISLGDSSGGAGTVQIYDNISVRELRPEEEW